MGYPFRRSPEQRAADGCLFAIGGCLAICAAFVLWGWSGAVLAAGCALFALGFYD